MGQQLELLLAAVNASSATPGNVVLFPSGTYLHNTAINVSGVRTSLRGLNRGNTILTGAEINLTAEGENLLGLTINSTNLAISSSSSRATISNCNFSGQVIFQNLTDVQISSCAFNFGNVGVLAMVNTDRVSLKASRVTSNAPTSTAIYGSAANNLSIQQTEIITRDGYGTQIYGSDKVLVEGCNIRL